MEKSRSASTKKGMRAKEKILNAALYLINEKGYEETTLVDICTAAGIANGTFYHYFKSKQDILLDYVRQESADLIKYYDSLSKDSYASALINVLIYQADYFIRKGTEFVSNFYAIMLLTKDSSFFSYDEFSLNAIVLDCFTRGQAGGEFTDRYSPVFMQELTIGLLYGLTSVWCISQGSFDLKTQMETRFADLISMCQNAYRE